MLSLKNWKHIQQTTTLNARIFIKDTENEIGFRNNIRKEWISDTAWKLNQARKGVQAALNSSKTRSNKIKHQNMYNRYNR